MTRKTMARFWRAGLAALVASVAVGAQSLPAAAAMAYATSDGTAGAFSATDGSGGHEIQLNGEFAGVADGDTLQEVFWCAASSTPDATSTLLQSCTLGNVPAVSAWQYPGGLAVAAGYAQFSLSALPGGSLALCGGAVAAFAETVMGAGSVGVSGCTPAPTATPALPDPNQLLADLSTLVAHYRDGAIATEKCLTFQTCIGPY